ncbi:MAG: helix-turn-helix transcriptional regulator [Methanocorpusculum sp.]|jgi:transcriptional regulator with XRE-family HTH domain|nr:helix-turn-helix transcriptional regulator [Methanocorpusculum sp.]
MDNENQMTALQRAIRQERKSKRITYEELAEMLDISPTHIKHIESGHRKPSIEILFEIARVLNLSLDGVVFPKDITQSDLTRGKIDRLLDSLDEDSLQFVLTVLEALHVKEQADG